MQLLSAHAALSLFVGVLVALPLIALGLHPIAALIIGALAGWALVHTVLKDLADRAERWLTTMR